MNLKHILALGLTTGVLLSWTPAQAVHASADVAAVSLQAADTSSTVITGTADSVSWTLSNETLTITSSTDTSVSLPDYAPWIASGSITKQMIRNVIINANINSIGERVFIGYPNLQSVTVKGSLLKIGASAFEKCPTLSSITFSGSVGSIGTQAFNNCTALENITFPESVGSIGKSAFEGCTGLNSVKILKGSTTIGEQAFLNCNNLSTINIANGALNIGEFAFENCTKLSTIAISDSTTTIGKGAFLGCAALNNIILPKELTSINESAFNGCKNLGNINIPSKVTAINKQAFLNCVNLKQVEIPACVKFVGESAFTGCTSLSMVTIPRETTNIASLAFNGCTSLTDIRYTGTETQWKNLNIRLPQVKTAQVLQKVYYNYTTNHKHSYITYKIGDKIILICKNCGDHQENTTPAPAPETTHKWSGWTTISAATVFKGAVQKRTCSTCKKTETKTGSKLKPTICVNATSFPLKINQKTTAFKVNGFAKGDSVASWKSSNPKVVKVSGSASGSNKITATKKTGKATITITLKSGLKKNITVTVQKKAVAAKKITGVPKNLTLKVKKNTSLKPVLNPITCVDKVTYKTSNNKVAAINSKGKITAKKKGTAVITIKAGKKTVKCKVTVK